MPLPKLSAVSVDSFQTVAAGEYDALAVVFIQGQLPAMLGHLMAETLCEKYLSVDSALEKDTALVISETAPGHRLVLSCVGTLTDDTDDVRNFSDAAAAAVRRARSAGATKPLLLLPAMDMVEATGTSAYHHYQYVALLGALQECYEPLQRREFFEKYHSKQVETVERVGVMLADAANVVSDAVLATVSALEHGRRLARDIGGGDPERMAPKKCAEAILDSFEQDPGRTTIGISVEDNFEVLEKEYPLLAAVARASMAVPRHHPCVVRMEYKSPDQSKVKENLYFVGKGITYDTGGADVKSGGAMRGMSRDKCGAASVAGLFRALSHLSPEHVNVTAYLSFVRNSIGADSYVSDEMIVSRAGVRVLVGNTDAEGRMVMSDPLCRLREESLANEASVPSHFFTVATLTGHVIRAYGNYGAIVANAACREANIPERIFKAGNHWGDPFEISTLRREDFAFGRSDPRGICDVVQSNSKPSTLTDRGHQSAGAFIMRAAGMVGGKTPVSFAHLDVAGSAEEPNGVGLDLARVTGSPVVALSAAFFQLQHC